MLVAEFKGNDKFTRVSGLTQWSYGQKLFIPGLDIDTKTIEVHFANEGSDTALRVLGMVENGDITADIPDILLQSGNNIEAYVYRSTETEGETIRKILLYVRKRQKPEDYTEEQYKNALQKVLEIAQSVRNDADAGKFNGQNGKDAYELAVEAGFTGTREEWLDSLKYDHSEEFEALARQVREDAEQAESAKQAADNKASASAQSAEAAKTSADNASKSAGDAERYAETASGAAGAAASAKEAAGRSAADAGEKAVQAAKSAEMAKQEADRAEQAAGKIDEETLLKLAIKERTEGKQIHLTDSAEFPPQGLNVYGRSEQKTTTGAQLFDVNAGGTGWLNQDTGEFEASRANYVSDFISVKPNTKYYCSYDVSFNIRSYDKDKTHLRKESWKNSISTGEDVAFIRFAISAEPDVALQKAETIMFNEGESAKPYEPYTGGKSSPNLEYPQEIVSAGDNGIIDVSVIGKNLLIPDKHVFKNLFMKAGTTLTLQTKDGVKSMGGNVLFTDSDGKNYWFAIDAGRTYVTHKLEKDVVGYSNELVGDVLYCLSVGELTEYEPYQEQPLPLQTPNSLPGIPVTSGGNYTDENGQQWVCDEIDFERGKYVQRIAKSNLKNIEWLFYWNEQYNIEGTILVHTTAFNDVAKGGQLCNFFRNVPNVLYDAEIGMQSRTDSYSIAFRVPTNIASNVEEWVNWINRNPVNFIYQLKTPIETDLPQEVIEAYKNLHTNYPTTNITNSADAHMEVKYVADTKNYIAGIRKLLQQSVANTNVQLLKRM